jgi:hypothetical protein
MPDRNSLKLGGELVGGVGGQGAPIPSPTRAGAVRSGAYLSPLARFMP